MLATIFVVLMLFWLFFGGYFTYDRERPYLLGSTLIPWACVAILGWKMFEGAAQLR